MLMIPAVPSGENWADGLVITSTPLTLEAGRDCRTEVPEGGGLPLIRICTPGSPRRAIRPVGDTVTEGMRLRMSSATPPCDPASARTS